MDSERKRILQMLKEGVIDLDEAERLLDTLKTPAAAEKTCATSAKSTPHVDAHWDDIHKQIGEHLVGVKRFVGAAVDNISSKFKEEFSEGKYRERLDRQGEKGKQEAKIERKAEWTYGELKLENSAGKVCISPSGFPNDLLYFNFESQVSKLPALFMQEADFIKYKVDELATDRVKTELSMGAGLTKLYLGPAIIWKLDVSLNAGNLHLDLRNIKWQDAAIQMNAANCKILVGEVVAPTSIKIDVNAGCCKLKLLEGTQIRIKVDNAMSATNFEKMNLKKNEGYLQSESFDINSPFIDLILDLNVSNLILEYYTRS